MIAVWYVVLEADFSHHTATARPPAVLSYGCESSVCLKGCLFTLLVFSVCVSLSVNVERAYDLVAQEQVGVTPPLSFLLLDWLFVTRWLFQSGVRCLLPL